MCCGGRAQRYSGSPARGKAFLAGRSLHLNFFHAGFVGVVPDPIQLYLELPASLPRCTMWNGQLQTR